MRQVTTARNASPAATRDREVVEFRSQFGASSPLDELVRTGAQRMLQTAIETEVEEFVTLHRDRRDASGHRQVVRHQRGVERPHPAGCPGRLLARIRVFRRPGRPGRLLVRTLARHRARRRTRRNGRHRFARAR